MARELRATQVGRRPARAAYASVPLTGHCVTLRPGYQLLGNLGTDYLAPHRGELPAQPDGCGTTHAPSLAQICVCDDGARFRHVQGPDGITHTSADLIRDAERWELASAEDWQWLSAHSHGHDRATTCVARGGETLQ